MENASKALIIAGAILISIVLIAVGVMVVNGANGAIDTAVGSMSDHEKTIFNQKFEPYQGKSVKGSSVKSLISAVVASNATVTDSGSGLKIKVEASNIDADNYSKNPSDDESDMTDIKSHVKNSGIYKVTLSYTSGVVSGVKIEKGS